MRKTFIIFAILLIGCATRQVSVVSNFPTINIKTGVEKSIDLTKYISNFSNVIIGETDGVSADYSVEEMVLNLTADGSKSIIILPLKVDGEKVDLLIRVNPMVEQTFTITPEEEPSNIIVMGQFNDWSRTALPLFDKDGDGTFERKVYLEPKRHEYKFVVDGEELIDPNNPIFISNNIGGWNSILDLSDHKTESAGRIIKERWEKGLLTYRYKPLDDDSPIGDLVLIHNNSVLKEHYTFENNLLSVDYMKLGDGTLRITGVDSESRIIPENITIIKDNKPLNPNDHPNDWHFLVLYNLMVDRFLDGNKENTVKIKTDDLHDLANWHGGDLAGIIQKLDEGYFTDLGINSIWISPINLQPDSAYVEWIPPNNKFSGYHGYWPIAAREIDPRYGTEKELKRLVDLAHYNDIKVIIDFVSNHTHQEHPYFREHRDWYGEMTLPNGEVNIRNWSIETQLTTWFDEFIPSFDFPSAPEAANQVVEDALWWLETFNFDGFRQDAVRHVPHYFWKKLTMEMNKRYPDKHLYQIGETFGSDELIMEYVNPGELDAQFNFGIYFNTRAAFADDNTDFSSFNNLLQSNLDTYYPVNLMGNITSSHDQMRFMGIADGQVTWGDDCYERSFYNPPTAVQNESSYSKLANFHAFNISIPGVPVVYYGEEIGLMGSCDPGNRRPMRFGKFTTQLEQELFARIGKLNELRNRYPSLSIGDLELIRSEGPLLIIEKSYFDEKIIIVINNGLNEMNVASSMEYGKLKDLVTDQNYSINDNKFELNIKPYSNRLFLVQ